MSSTEDAETESAWDVNPDSHRVTSSPAWHSENEPRLLWTPPYLLFRILSVHKPSPSSLDLGQRKEGRSFSSQEETDKYRGGKALSLSHSTKNPMEEKLCSKNWMCLEAGGRGQPRDGRPIRTAQVVTSSIP